MDADELLTRMAATLRKQIGPAVEEPFAKTQAFMASVVLEKVAKQVHHAAAHDTANAEDRIQLAADLNALVSSAGSPHEPVRSAIEAAGEGDEALAPLVQALYDHEHDLGSDLFNSLLGRTRTTLRARLDRQLEVAA
jgi:hypothetical protein